ncbi:MAG: hypothetical protein LBR27_08090 [Bifidobacteriaceae bacterium]|jgi:hypothetical protein|nr:hypothetical protein [Bifidobacteriaceae bacterium]
MYGWLWRHTPGPAWLKIFGALVAVAAIVAVCFTTFFPWISPRLPFNQTTVTEESPEPTPTITQTIIETVPVTVSATPTELPGEDLTELPGEALTEE